MDVIAGAMLMKMSIRENIEVFHNLNLDEYMRILGQEFGAEKHPAQPGAYVVQGSPFYYPTDQEDHVSILSFNKIPLPHFLVEALIEHPELAPDNVIVRWTQEQDLIWEGTLGELRRRSPRNK